MKTSHNWLSEEFDRIIQHCHEHRLNRVFVQTEGLRAYRDHAAELEAEVAELEAEYRRRDREAKEYRNRVAELEKENDDLRARNGRFYAALAYGSQVLKIDCERKAREEADREQTTE